MTEQEDDDLGEAPGIEEGVSDGGGDDQAAVDYEAEARKDGWVPKEEWKGRPGAHKDAKTWVENRETVAPVVRRILAEKERDIEARVSERVKRLEAMHEAAREREKADYDRRVGEIEARMARAVEDGDTEAWKAARAEEKALKPPEPVEAEPKEDGPPPAVQTWVARNGWFQTDAQAHAVAKAAAAEGAALGYGIDEQLRLAESRVRERFPHHFPKPPTTETGGNAPPPGRRTERGVSDLPKEARSQMKKDMARFSGHWKSEAEWAREYWSHA